MVLSESTDSVDEVKVEERERAGDGFLRVERMGRSGMQDNECEKAEYDQLRYL